MVFLWLPLALSAVGPSEAAVRENLATMARAGQCERVVHVAVRRGDQLPLRPEEALIAAHAARCMEDSVTEERFLEQALESPELGAVAAVELAELVVADQPDRAADLVLDLLQRAPTTELRRAAVEVMTGAVRSGIDADRRAALEKTLPTLPRSSRRPLELALATSTEPPDRARLRRMLSSETDDLVSLTAAHELEASGELGIVDQWRVAQTLYRHALYERASPILEVLDEVSDPQIPRREVAYLRGRCAFRQGRWDEAVAWYRKAISRAPSGERRAQLEVHLGRAHELAGEMDEAVAAAQRAVRLATTDDRRLFLARLRLRRDEPELARAGLSRLRGRSARSRGNLLLGSYALRNADVDAARRLLADVDRDPWRGPAAVLAAELAVESGDDVAALAMLDAASSSLDTYWEQQARIVVSGLNDEAIADWRRRTRSAIESPDPRTRSSALARALKLEPDPSLTAGLRSVAAAESDLEGEPEPPVFDAGVAAWLWGLGLEPAAVRWDPFHFPRNGARQTWWTAMQELTHGSPWRAIGTADEAWRQAATRLPQRGLPRSLRRALYPLPDATLVQQMARRHGVPWPLLAGVAREESRWNPTVVSPVGARGLMQLMPATAVASGAANGHPDVSPDDLFDAGISLDLGAAELGRLLRVFDGNRAATVAAYNAGEAQSRLWMDQCGDGCSEQLFVAHVSFSVTRSYVEDVLAAATVYQELYSERADSKIIR